MSLVDPLSTTARDLARGLREREVSAREVVQAHFDRIDAVNPVLNAVVTEVREQAMAAAVETDERTMAAHRFHATGVLPPLHGIPMTHKDTIATEGIRTTMGSPVYAEHVPGYSDLVIERLQAGGVITTGKTNVPEFGAGSHTFNEVFGATGNPWDPRLSAGGSSGGVAAVLAARVQPLGEGSDVGGSLRNPAAFCNVVGFRPSHGVVPVAPTLHPWAWLPRVGMMARDVADVALGMSVVSGPDPRVPAPCPVDPDDFAELVDEPVPDRPLTGLRIGLTVGFGLGVPVDPEIVAVVLAQAAVLESLGAEVDEACPDLRWADEVFDVTRAYDMAARLGDVVERHRDRVKEEVVWNVERGLALTARELISADLARGRLHRSVGEFFEGYDVLVAPVTQVLPFPVEERWPRVVAGQPMQTYVEWMRSVSLISATGCPAVSVPAGFTGAGLPVGLQLVGADGDDVRLLRVAKAYETATGHGKRLPELPRG